MGGRRGGCRGGRRGGRRGRSPSGSGAVGRVGGFSLGRGGQRSPRITGSPLSPQCPPTHPGAPSGLLKVLRGRGKACEPQHRELPATPRPPPKTPGTSPRTPGSPLRHQEPPSPLNSPKPPGTLPKVLGDPPRPPEPPPSPRIAPHSPLLTGLPKGLRDGGAQGGPPRGAETTNLLELRRVTGRKMGKR